MTRALLVTFAMATLVAVSIAPGAEAQGVSTVSGMVCDQESRVYYLEEEASECYGRGIPGATVELAGQTGDPVPVYKDTTDEEGRFYIDTVVNGDYTIMVTRAGFEPLEETIVAPAKELMLAPTPMLVEQLFQVTNDRERNVPDAILRICCDQEYGSQEARTDENGLAVATVEGGWASISVDAPGHQSFWMDAFIDGDESVSVVMERVPPADAFLSGRLLDQDGNGIGDVRIDAWSDRSHEVKPESDDEARGASIVAPGYYGGNNFTMTAADGTYELGVYSGRVYLNFHKEGYAYGSTQVDIAAGDSLTQDLKMLKFPEKTATLEGKVVDASTGELLPFVSISVESPMYGLYECSQDASEARPDEPKPMEASIDGDIAYPYYEGCAIVTNSDGFFGDVTPGYSIVRVYYDQWRACGEQRFADSGGTGQCGPEYLGWVQTMTLPADQTTSLVIELNRRAAPDAVISGYLVDEAGQVGVAGGRISFSHLEGGGYGWANADDDGSYKIGLRNGPHEVYVWADGYLNWAGTINVQTGDNTLDVMLTEGQRGGGGCCIAYARSEDAVGGGAGHGADGDMGVASPGAPMASAEGDDSGGQAVSYEDLNGGLGPYDPSRASGPAATADEKDASALGITVAIIGVAFVAALGRRYSN